MSSAGKSLPPLEDCRVLVTGGAGFIGSAVVWGLNRRGCHNVVVVDRLRHSEKWRHLSGLQMSDYLEAEEFWPRIDAGTMDTFDLVLHLGACSSTTEQNVAYLIRNNYELTKRLAYWALSVGARFVYASSAATYGNGHEGMRDTEPDVTRFRPQNAYGFSKYLFDCHAMKHGLLTKIVGLKYFNVFGPNEDHKGDMRSMVCKAWQQIVERGRVRLFKSYRAEYPDGQQRRDFVYVRDAVAMTLHLAGLERVSGLFNIGSGESHTWLELVTSVFQAMGRDPQIEFVDMPEHLREQYQYFTCAEISKLRETGYSMPVTPLPLAVKEYVMEYLIPGRVLDSKVP